MFLAAEACTGCVIAMVPEGVHVSLAGSYGKVFKAVRGGVQDVAIKIMHEADDEQLAQFEKVTMPHCCFSICLCWLCSLLVDSCVRSVHMLMV